MFTVTPSFRRSQPGGQSQQFTGKPLVTKSRAAFLMRRLTINSRAFIDIKGVSRNKTIFPVGGKQKCLRRNLQVLLSFTTRAAAVGGTCDELIWRSALSLRLSQRFLSRASSPIPCCRN